MLPLPVYHYPLGRPAFDYVVLGEYVKNYDTHVTPMLWVYVPKLDITREMIAYMHKVHSQFLIYEMKDGRELRWVMEKSRTGMQGMMDAFAGEVRKALLRKRVARALRRNYERRRGAAACIQQHWKDVITDPCRGVCKRRLLREFGVLAS